MRRPQARDGGLDLDGILFNESHLQTENTGIRPCEASHAGEAGKRGPSTGELTEFKPGPALGQAQQILGLRREVIPAGLADLAQHPDRGERAPMEPMPLRDQRVVHGVHRAVEDGFGMLLQEKRVRTIESPHLQIDPCQQQAGIPDADGARLRPLPSQQAREFAAPPDQQARATGASAQTAHDPPAITGVPRDAPRQEVPREHEQVEARDEVRGRAIEREQDHREQDLGDCPPRVEQGRAPPDPRAPRDRDTGATERHPQAHAERHTTGTPEPQDGPAAADTEARDPEPRRSGGQRVAELVHERDARRDHGERRQRRERGHQPEEQVHGTTIAGNESDRTDGRELPRALRYDAPRPGDPMQDADATGLDELIWALPRVLRPAEAVGWRTRLRISVGGAPRADLVVDAPTATVEAISETPPDTTLELGEAEAAAILRGELPPLTALQQGTLSIDNLGDLFQFARTFDLEALAEAAAGPAPAPLPEVDLPTGKQYRDGHVLVTPDDIGAFAAATNDLSPVYFGAGAIAPPMMHARMLRDLLFGIMEDPELGLDMLHLLHGEHDLRIHRHVQPWDVVTRRATLDHVEQKAKGLLVEGTLWGFVEGQPAIEARTAFFIRGQQLAPVGTGHRDKPRPVPIPDRAPDVSRSFRVDSDQSARYADASLDRNPVHIDPAIARDAGFPDVILHGLCTMALSGAALLRAVAFGDSRVLRRLAVRWTRPVQNDTTLQIRAWRLEPGHWRFEVVDAEGLTVIQNGVAELDESD